MRYVALLRGISPTNPKMRNENLRGVLEDLGYMDVETVISSGNVLFDSSSRSTVKLESTIEAAWPAQLGFESTTIVRSNRQLRELVGRDPFDTDGEDGPRGLQVTFLKEKPARRLAVPYTPSDEDFTIVAMDDSTICSAIDMTRSGSPDLMRWIEQQCGKRVTTRTWRTVKRIVAKLS